MFDYWIVRLQFNFVCNFEKFIFQYYIENKTRKKVLFGKENFFLLKLKKNSIYIRIFFDLNKRKFLRIFFLSKTKISMLTLKIKILIIF